MSVLFIFIFVFVIDTKPSFHCFRDVNWISWLLVVCWQIAKLLNCTEPLNNSAKDHVLVIEVAQWCSSSYVKLTFISVLESATLAHADQSQL